MIVFAQKMMIANEIVNDIYSRKWDVQGKID